MLRPPSRTGRAAARSTKERGPGVGREQLLERVVGDRRDRGRRRRRPGDGDDDVHTTKAGLGLDEEVRDRALSLRSPPDRNRLDAAVDQVGDGRVGFLTAAEVVHDHVCALIGECLRDHLSDTAGRAVTTATLPANLRVLAAAGAAVMFVMNQTLSPPAGCDQ